MLAIMPVNKAQIPLAFPFTLWYFLHMSQRTALAEIARWVINKRRRA